VTIIIQLYSNDTLIANNTIFVIIVLIVNRALITMQ